MRLLPHRFRNKLLLTMLLLVLFVELTTISAVLRTTYKDSMSQARSRLAAGFEVMAYTLSERRDQLSERVQVLAADFGFRSAVATGDSATIASVLANQGRRAGADQVLLLNPNGKLQVGVPTDLAQAGGRQFEALVAQAERDGGASLVAVTGKAAYQFVMVPVNAPGLIGWVVMGFELNQELATALRNVTGLDVVFSIQQSEGELSRVSTFTRPGWVFPADRFALESGAQSDAQVFLDDGLIMAGQRLAGASSAAGSGSPHIYGAVLVEEAKVLRAHHELRLELLVIFAVTLVLSIIAAFGLSGAIGRPLRQLAEFAQTVGGGTAAAIPQFSDRGELGLLASTLGRMQDAIKAREARILHQLSHDQLTGLPNRGAAEKYLAEQISQNRNCLILRAGLRGFKEINESLGYAFGDQILQATALRIRAAIDVNERVFRVGGNEFLAVIDGNRGSALNDTGLEEIFRERIERPVDLMDSPITLRLDLGALALPSQAASVEQVLRRSAIALDRSGSASGRTAFYTDGEDEIHLRELTLTRDLQHSLAAGQMRLVYQPQVAMLPSAQVVQFEALLRWRHPELGIVPPDEFIVLAERSGQIGHLSDWVIKAAIADLVSFRAQGFDQAVSVNLSAHDLEDAQLPQRILALLGAHRLGPEALTVEVTESALMGDPRQAVESLSALTDAGIDIAIDDFGTGYSSLAQLKQLPVGELKIDKAFVLQLASNREDQLIVRSTIGLAHTLGLRVVAEGIEDLQSWRLLREFGCDRGQGYLLAKPLEAHAVNAWLKRFPETLAPYLNAFPDAAEAPTTASRDVQAQLRAE